MFVLITIYIKIYILISNELNISQLSNKYFFPTLVYDNINIMLSSVPFALVLSYLIIGLGEYIPRVILFSLSVQEKEWQIISECSNKIVWGGNRKEDLIFGQFETYPGESMEKKIKCDYE